MNSRIPEANERFFRVARHVESGVTFDHRTQVEVPKRTCFHNLSPSLGDVIASVIVATFGVGFSGVCASSGQKRHGV